MLLVVGLLSSVIKTSSMRPYSLASPAIMKLSRSVSCLILSTGWPVCLASSSLSVSRVLQDLLGVDLDVRRLALEAAERLVDHDARVRQRVALALGAGREQEAPIDAAWPMQIVATSQRTYCMVS